MFVLYCFYLNHCIDLNLGDGTKSPLMMANFVQNDISPLIFFFFWQPVYYLLDAEEQSFLGRAEKMRTHWVGIDESIGTNMCWTLVDDNSGEIICRSAIRSAIESDTTNLQVDPVQSLPDPIDDTKGLLNNFMSLTNFETPLPQLGLVDSIPDSTKLKV